MRRTNGKMKQKSHTGVRSRRFVLYYLPHMATRTNKSGQTMVEYIIVFAVLLGVVAALMRFIGVARSSAARTTTLVTCDYP